MANSRELRRILDLDQLAFARLVGVDLRSVTRWEAGTSEPVGPAAIIVAVLTQRIEVEGPGGRTVQRIRKHAAVGEGLGAILRDLFEATP